VTVGLAAAIQNRLSWRACEKVSGAINFLRRWYRELPRLSLHRARCEKGGQDTGGTAISVGGLIHRENAALAG